MYLLLLLRNSYKYFAWALNVLLRPSSGRCTSYAREHKYLNKYVYCYIIYRSVVDCTSFARAAVGVWRRQRVVTVHCWRQLLQYSTLKRMQANAHNGMYAQGLGVIRRRRGRAMKNGRKSFKRNRRGTRTGSLYACDCASTKIVGWWGRKKKYPSNTDGKTRTGRFPSCPLAVCLLGPVPLSAVIVTGTARENGDGHLQRNKTITYAVDSSVRSDRSSRLLKSRECRLICIETHQDLLSPRPRRRSDDAGRVGTEAHKRDFCFMHLCTRINYCDALCAHKTHAGRYIIWLVRIF